MDCSWNLSVLYLFSHVFLIMLTKLNTSLSICSESNAVAGTRNVKYTTSCVQRMIHREGLTKMHQTVYELIKLYCIFIYTVYQCESPVGRNALDFSSSVCELWYRVLTKACSTISKLLDYTGSFSCNYTRTGQRGLGLWECQIPSHTREKVEKKRSATTYLLTQQVGFFPQDLTWMCSFVSVIGKPEVRGLTASAGHT